MKGIPIRHIADIKSSQGTAGTFTIRRIGDVLDGSDLFHERHRHDFYFLLVLSHGTGVHEIDLMPYPVSERSVFLLRPGQVHQLQLSRDSAGYLLQFDAVFYHPGAGTALQRFRKVTQKNHCRPEPARYSKLLTLLQLMIEEYTEKEPGYAAAISAALDLFFIELARQSSSPHTIAGITGGYSGERFEELMHLLETNITSLKNVSQYAGLLALSPYQLNAITRAAVGKTASDLINEQIVLESKRHLLGTTHQVKDIAFHLGYEDVSYFIRFFRKHTGQSPEAFRKAFRQTA